MDLFKFEFIIRIYKEIKSVGIKDWCWFTFYLRRSEFSPKLDMGVYYFRKNYKTLEYTQLKLYKDRCKAHVISNKLDDIC